MEDEEDDVAVDYEKTWLNHFISENYGEEHHRQCLKPGLDYYKSEQAPANLKVLIAYLSNCYMIQYKMIASWRYSPEWDESLDSPIAYYLVNILVFRKTNYIPPDLRQWLTEFTRTYIDKDGNEIDLRFEYLKAAFNNTNKNIIPLNNFIQKQQVPLADIKNFTIPEQTKKYISRGDDCHFPDDPPISEIIETLYGNGGNSVVIFSGISTVVFSDEQLNDFMTKKEPFRFPIRSWTIDLRVAVHFAQVRDHLKVIFMMHTTELCFISSLSSWEAEVFKPAGDYIYKGHFTTTYQEIIGNTVTKNKTVTYNNTVTKRELLIIVIARIDPIIIPDGKMKDIKNSDDVIEGEEYPAYIRRLYDESGLAEEETQNYVDEEEAKEHWDEVMETLKDTQGKQERREYNIGSTTWDTELLKQEGGRGRRKLKTHRRKNRQFKKRRTQKRKYKRTQKNSIKRGKKNPMKKYTQRKR